VRHIDSEQNHSIGRLLKAKNQFSKVLVAGHDNATLCRGCLEYKCIRSFWRKARCSEHVVIRLFQEIDNEISDVRIDEQFHVRLKGA